MTALGKSRQTLTIRKGRIVPTPMTSRKRMPMIASCWKLSTTLRRKKSLGTVVRPRPQRKGFWPYRCRRSALVQPGDQLRQELAQYRRPFGVFGAAGRMAEIAVELEIARLGPGRGQRLDDTGRDLWREQRVGAAQDVEHPGLDPGEIRPGVEAEQCAAQDDQRVGVPFGGPVRGLLADRRLARRRVGETRRQRGLAAVALPGLDPDVGQHRLAPRPAVITAAMPFGIAGEPRF